MKEYKELTGEKRVKFKKWLKQFQKENDRSPTIEEVYDEATKTIVVEHFEAYGQCRDSRQIADLEEKISVLLSCKNCPENKGGLICQKEYENKCLAQKIEFIKELQKENAELKQENNNLVTVIEKSKSWGISPLNSLIIKNLDDQLTKAKEIISEYVRLANLEKEDTVAIWQLYHKAEQFINSEV